MNWLKLVGVFGVVTVLASCGGGGDVAGDTDEFFTNPAEFKWGVSSCAPEDSYGNEVLVTIVGGTPPYRIHNSLPKYLSVDRTVATGKDPVFKITTLGGCLDPGTITVLDYHSRTTTIEVTVEVAD